MAPMNRLSQYKKSTAEEDLLPGYETAVKQGITIEQVNIIQENRQVIHNINQVRATTTQILDLRSDKYQFIKPLPVTISEEDNLYVVTSYDLNLFGYGETEDEAIQDLCETIVEYYEDIENNKENLGKIPIRDKHFLEQIIQKCS
ncbi:MAG: hypothetical protein QME51_06215 [Planctomycetota bacterium]|nr:hypothetical protein [Planctomycetota bacterium]